MNDQNGAWFNFETDEYEYIDTPKDFAPYIPDGATRNLYRLYVETGQEPIEAAKEVLMRLVGDLK